MLHSCVPELIFDDNMIPYDSVTQSNNKVFFQRMFYLFQFINTMQGCISVNRTQLAPLDSLIAPYSGVTVCAIYYNILY